MYIERNGTKIELTSEELRLAHEEYEKGNVKEDIASVFAVDYLGCVDEQDFYAAYNDKFDANEDYNSQIRWAIKSILCDKSFEFKLYKVQEVL